MKLMVRAGVFAAWLLAVAGFAADKYTGPKPPKPDLPYLVHAGNLVPTESAEAKEAKKGKDVIYTIAGAASTARTPLAEPIFLLDAQSLTPEHIELYKVEARNGEREVALSQKGRRGAAHAIHLTVSPQGGKLYRLEAGETLENGEYCLSPSDSNHVFCFSVY